MSDLDQYIGELRAELTACPANVAGYRNADRIRHQIALAKRERDKCLPS